jgi:preprotein translocase subunit SecD
MGTLLGQVVQRGEGRLDVYVPQQALTADEPGYLFESTLVSAWAVDEDFTVPEAWMKQLIVSNQVLGKTSVQEMAQALANSEPPLGQRRLAWQLPERQGENLVLVPLTGVPIFTQQHVLAAKASISNETLSHYVEITLDTPSTQRFAEATEKMVGKKMAIVVNDRVLSAPVILEPITGGVVWLTLGGQSIDPRKESLALAAVLQTKPLPGVLTLEQLSLAGPGTQLTTENP